MDHAGLIRSLVDVVWTRGELDALPQFWTASCVNHAAGGAVGFDELRAYHQQMAGAFSAFSGLAIEVVQQVTEGDRVVTHMVARGRHSGSFAGVAPTGRPVALATIRIDRIEDGRIAEHWSVADMAGLMQQLQD